MARILLPLFFLAALIGLGILLVFGNDGNNTDNTTPNPTELAEEEGAQQADVLEEVEMDTEQANRIERTDVKTETPTEASAAYEPSLEQGGILVSIVQGEKDLPVPFADVLVLDSGLVNMQEMRSYLAGSMDIERVLRQFGTAYQADKAGQVRIPDAIGMLAIGGVTETLFEFDGDAEIVEQAFTLRLKAIDLVKVKVVDQEGSPVAGVLATIRHHRNNRSINTIGSPTNIDGLANLKVFDGLKREMGSNGKTSVALAILTPIQVEKPIDLSALPKETVVLVMPETGKVNVLLLDKNGKAATGEFMLQLSIHDPVNDSNEIVPLSHWAFDAKNRMAGTKDGTGQVTFDSVALGQEVRVRVSSRDQTKLAMTDGLGPTTAGETVTFTLVPEVLSPIIAGRLIAPDGTPLADEAIHISFEERESSGMNFLSHYVDTDASGRFQAPFDGVVHMNAQYDCRIQTREDQGESPWAAVASLPKPVVVGKMDLGDIKLEPMPTLLQGRVVDQIGEPVEHAQVMLEKDINLDDPNAHSSWNPMLDFHDRTDADGVFHIRGFASPGTYRANTSHFDFDRQFTDIFIGAEDVEIMLQGETRIAGKVLTDSWLDPQELQLLVRTANEYGGYSTSFHSFGENGSFVINPSDDSTGLATVSITSKGASLTLFSMEDIDLSAPETVQLLETIDLRGLLHQITLTVRNEGGEFLEYVGVRSETTSVGRGLGEMVQIVSLTPSMNLEITADGHGVVYLNNASGHHDVVLPSGYKISITLDNPSVVADGWRVQGQLALVSKDEDGMTHSMIIESDVAMDGSPIVVSRPGDYTVILTADEIKPNGRRYWGVPGDDPEFTVENVTGVQNFTISIPAEAFEFLGALGSED